MGSRATLRRGDVFAAVDIGASKTACVIAAAVSGGGVGYEIIGCGVSGAAIDGRGPGAAATRERAFKTALESAERMAGVRVKSLAVAAPGATLAARRSGVDLELDGDRLTREDVAQCLDHAAAACGEGAALLHALPVSYRLDGAASPAPLEGHSGDLFSLDCLTVAAREHALHNLELIFERSGLGVDLFAAAPYAAAEAVLVDDEKDLGVVLLDIGASSTGYAVYEDGKLVDCGGVPVGGDHVTRDIAQVFGAPVARAERVKTLYGASISGPGDEHRMVEIELIGAGDRARLPRAELCAVILPRMEEICELAAERLPATVRSRHGVRRAVLTGGASLLVGARETAERVLGMKARLGRPATGLIGAPEAATGPQFAVAVGALALSHRARIGAETAERRPAPVLSQAAGGGVMSAVGRWLRVNF